MASSCICIQTNKAAFNSFPQKNSVFFLAFLHFYHDNHVSFGAFYALSQKTMIFCRFQPFFCKKTYSVYGVSAFLLRIPFFSFVWSTNLLSCGTCSHLDFSLEKCLFFWAIFLKPRSCLNSCFFFAIDSLS